MLFRSHCPQIYRLNFGMICCLFSYSTDAGYIKLIVWISSTAPEAAWRNFPFYSLFAQLLGFSLVFSPPPCVGHIQASFSHPGRRGYSHGSVGCSCSLMPGGGTGMVVITGMQGEPAMAEAAIMLQQPEVRCVFSWGSCPWIMGHWQ